MTNIHTYQELLEEKQRLTLLLAERKVLVKTEFEEIKQKLAPVKSVIETIQKFTSKDKTNPLVNVGIDFGVNLLLKNFVLRNAGWLVRIVMPYMVKNFLSHEVAETDNIFASVGNKISDLFSTLKKKFTPHQPA